MLYPIITLSKGSLQRSEKNPCDEANLLRREAGAGYQELEGDHDIEHSTRKRYLLACQLKPINR